ncbi:hypothetical protein PC123_g5931 [Phytophthora cactorum]|nr:hypothetical protein PC123_g5931 [Phytophthora cactorum]
MGSDEMAPLQAHVDVQVKHLTAVAGLVRELQSAEEQYGKEYAELPFDVQEDVLSTIKQLPHLQEVSQGLGHFVHKCSEVKAAVAQDLTQQVIAPLEALTADHVEKAQHLLSELYELLQKEKAYDLAYQNLREGCKYGDASQEESTLADQDESELQLHRVHRDQLLRKRDAERLAIQQWITALHFSGQRYEAHVRDVLRQTRAVYERMITSMTALIRELQEQLNQDAHAASTSTINSSRAVSDESWERLLRGYDCHVAITGWMSELFKRLIPLEQTAAKSLQKALKLDRALSKAFGGVGFSSQLSGLIEFHGLLTVNIANPIMRTLKFTKERLERMRNELSKSLEETRTLMVAARAQLDARVAKDTGEEKDPVRCDSLTSSESSDCSLEDNNEENENSSCNAGPNEEENTPEHIQLETVERKLVLQRQEMTRVLDQTSFLAVKTMELMVQDYVKHVTKALAALSETIRAESPQIQQSSHTSLPQPWEHITERLSIAVSDKPGLSVHEASDNQRHLNPKDDTATKRADRRCRSDSKEAARGIREPSVVQVALSFVQSAVGVVWWAAFLGFKNAKAHVPHSFEDRAVLVIIAVTILTLTSICVKSNQLQDSWSNLTDTQHSNSQDLVHMVKLSAQVCTQQLAQ